MTELTTQTPAQLAVPTPTGTLNLQFELGSSIVIVGANGSGKTRLGVHIEQGLAGSDIVHRIAAQKVLAMEDVQLISFETAERMLRYGMQTAVPSQKLGYRWQNKPATQLLNDFQALLQTLFGQQNRIAVRFLDQHRQNPALPTPFTVLQRVQDVWQRLLPHRELELQEAAIQVKPLSSTSAGDSSVALSAEYYRAAEMSEVVATLDSLGTGSAMSRATMLRQADLGALGIVPPSGLDAKLAALRPFRPAEQAA